VSHTLPSAPKSSPKFLKWFGGLFPLAPSPQPQEPEGEEPRHLVEALGGAQRLGA
jgi:hypothetical protein